MKNLVAFILVIFISIFNKLLLLFIYYIEQVCHIIICLRYFNLTR